MKSIWTVKYNENEIRVENTWFNGERLFVNGKLQDEKFSFFSSDLIGHLKTSDGEKKTIKVNLGGFFKIGCRLFVDDEKIEVTQLK